MLQISIAFGLVTMAISLVTWVVVSNKFHQHWDFGSASGASFFLGIILGTGLFALISKIGRWRRRPTVCNLSIQEAATQVRDAVVGPIEVVGRDSAWTEDPLSILSKPDSSNTQVLSFQSVIEDIDAESRRNYSVGRISSSLSLIVTLTEVSGKTSVEIYVSSVTGISAGMVNLVLDDARSRINQSLKYN